MDDYKRKYEEALGRARTFSQKWQGIEATDSELALQELKEIFPELKESEDEMIRKDLIGYFEDCGNMTFAHHRVSDIIAWLEKQGEQEHVVVVPRFRVGDVIRPKGSMAEYTIESIYGGCYHCKGWGLFIGCDEDYELVEQKPTDKVETKFKVGDWVTDGNITIQIEAIKNDCYLYCGDCVLYSTKTADKVYHLWSIQDAKDGDVLSYVTDEGDLWIMIYRSLYKPYEGHLHYHAVLVNDNFTDKGTCCICIDNLKPATKEQRDLFFSKLKEAGYEWDAEKKELKKIEQETELLKGEDYGIDGLYNAVKILENTLGKVDGYQTDDGILKHKCAIEAVKRLYEQKKSTWSVVDDYFLNLSIENLTEFKNNFDDGYSKVGDCIHWLKSLRERVLPQYKQ